MIIIIKDILLLLQSIIEVIGGVGSVIIILGLFNNGQVNVRSKSKMTAIVFLGTLLSLLINISLHLCK
jgi:hypothetical protein